MYLQWFYINFVYVRVRMCEWAHHSVQVEVRGHMALIVSFHLYVGLSYQACPASTFT